MGGLPNLATGSAVLLSNGVIAPAEGRDAPEPGPDALEASGYRLQASGLKFRDGCEGRRRAASCRENVPLFEGGPIGPASADRAPRRALGRTTAISARECSPPSELDRDAARVVGSPDARRRARPARVGVGVRDPRAPPRAATAAIATEKSLRVFSAFERGLREGQENFLQKPLRVVSRGASLMTRGCEPVSVRTTQSSRS